MRDADRTVREAIQRLLARRADDNTVLDLSSDLHEDLGLDSLELAELSASLEESLGRDPYTQGIVPRTVGDILAFYAT